MRAGNPLSHILAMPLFSLHMSVITQFDGNSALMMAARQGRTEVVSLLLKAGANTDLQNNVHKVDSYCLTITCIMYLHRMETQL